jgi:hypothetical protein
MVIVTLLTAFLLAQVDRMVIDRPPDAAQLEENAFAIEAEPLAITRGRTTTIVVKGRDGEALKTLAVNPPDGIKLGEIKALPPAADGRKAVSVAVTVDAKAEPGDRELTLTVAPTIAGSGARPGDDEAAKQMDAMIKEIIKRETRPQPAGALRINSHDVKITKVELVSGTGAAAMRITVEDEQGDIEGASRSGAEAPKEGEIVMITEPLSSEVRCGKEVFYAVLRDSTIHERKPPTVVLQAAIDASELAGKSGCDLHVQVEDKAGNVSGWFVTKLWGEK